MKLFISGWTGFREVLEDFLEDWYFYNPLLSLDEKGILNFLKTKSDDTITGWFTDGHIYS